MQDFPYHLRDFNSHDHTRSLNLYSRERLLHFNEKIYFLAHVMEYIFATLLLLKLCHPFS